MSRNRRCYALKKHQQRRTKDRMMTEPSIKETEEADL